LALLVLVLGCLLTAVGAGYLLIGFDIVMTERGSAMTIGGATALSGGIITIGLGLVVLRLTQVLRTLEAAGRGVSPVPSADEREAAEKASPVVPVVAAGALAAAAASGLAVAQSAVPDASVPDVPDVDALPETALEPEPLEAVIERITIDRDAVDDAPPSPAPEVEGIDDVLADATPEPRPGGMMADKLDEVRGDEPADDAQATAELTEAPDLVSPPDVETISEPSTSDPSDEDEQPARGPLQPTVLGNYRAGGRTYTMYSNGTVEALTEHGTERFESMQALRDHLAKT
jgi:hypothetical protein